jgi:hypothetical protein
MTLQVLNRGTVANDGTGDTLRTAGLKIGQNFSEIYNKLGDGASLMALIDFDSSGIIFDGTTANVHKTALRVVNPTGTNTAQIPDHTGILTMDTNTQTLTNKTLTSPVLTTPQINDTSANHQYVFAVSELSADRTVTLPVLTTNDELTFNACTQTMSSKTINTSLLNDPKIVGAIDDASGNELLSFVTTSSAVNHIQITNSANNGDPKISALGDDNNVNLALDAKGNGAIALNSRVLHKTQGISSTGGTVNASDPITLFTSGSTGTHTMGSAVAGTNGIVKYLVSSGAGIQTINDNSNIAGGNTLTIPQNGSVTLMWFTNTWIVTNLQGGATLA